MDHETQRLLAHADQARATVRDDIRALPACELASLIRTCARGELACLDERAALLVGMVAVTAIFDIIEPKQEIEP